MNYQDVTEYIKKYRLAPRDISLAAQFILKKVGHNRIYIFGAGSHTCRLLDEFKKTQTLPHIAGIIDQRVKGSYLGYKVFHPWEIKEKEADFIVLSHNEYEHTMAKDLYDSGITIPVLSIYSNDEFLELSLKKVDLHINVQTGLKRILFVSLEREIISREIINGLKDEFFMIKGYLNREGIFEEKGCYNIQVDLKQSFALLFQLIEQFSPHLIYVHDQYSRGNFLAAFLKEKYKSTKVVGEYYDLLQSTFDDPYIATKELYYSPQDVKIILWGEKKAKDLDGIVIKERGDYFSQKYKESNILYFGQYIAKKHTKFIEKQIPGRDLVFSGSVNRAFNSPVLFGDNQFISVFRQLIILGFTIHLYFNIDRHEEIKNLYPEYIELANETGKLHVYARLSVKNLILSIASFDYGIILGHFTDETLNANRIRIKTTFPSKIYTYIAAGLPILLNKFEAAGEFVEKWGIGKKIENYEEIKDISQDQYISFKENLRSLQERYSVEQQRGRFYKFIRNL